MSNSLYTYQLKLRLMGSAFELLVLAGDAAQGQAHLHAAVAEIRRIEALLTEFSDTSVTAQLNSRAGREPLAVGPEVYALLERCQLLSELSQGAFDITAGVLKPLYDFRRGAAGFPEPARLRAALQGVGYQHVELLPGHQVRLRRAGMRIGFGAIGKGYAADCARALLERRGVAHGVVNASGDLTAWGRPAGGTGEGAGEGAGGAPWRVGVADPAAPGRVLLWLPLPGAAVATSGNYEQYFEHRGVRYAHTLDPRTGRPTRHVASATVVAAKAELADALATALTVLGPDVGLHLLNQLPDTHGVLVDDQHRVFTSKSLTLPAHA